MSISRHSPLAIMLAFACGTASAQTAAEHARHKAAPAQAMDGQMAEHHSMAEKRMDRMQSLMRMMPMRLDRMHAMPSR